MLIGSRSSTAPSPHATQKSAARRVSEPRSCRCRNSAKHMSTPAATAKPCKVCNSGLSGTHASTGGPEKNWTNSPLTDAKPSDGTQNDWPAWVSCADATTSHGTSAAAATVIAAAAARLARQPARSMNATANSCAGIASAAK